MCLKWVDKSSKSMLNEVNFHTQVALAQIAFISTYPSYGSFGKTKRVETSTIVSARNILGIHAGLLLGQHILDHFLRVSQRSLRACKLVEGIPVLSV